MRSLIFGASAGVGRSLARVLAARGHALVLIARDERDLKAEAAHVRVLYDTPVEWRALDATRPDLVADTLATLPCEPIINNLFFPIGMAYENDDCTLPGADAASLVNANLVSVITAISIFLPPLIVANAGNVVGMGSVAAIRGRGRNAVYAASKRGLESYFQSLRHRVARTGVRVQFYRLGYVDTQLAFALDTPLPKIGPLAVAERIVRGLDRDPGIVSVPRFWWAVGSIVKAMPWSIFSRLDF